MSKKQIQYTPVELEIDTMLSDGMAHSFREIYSLVHADRDNDSEFCNRTFSSAIKNYKRKLAKIEAGVMVVNSMHGRRLMLRKVRNYNDRPPLTPGEVNDS